MNLDLRLSKRKQMLVEETPRAAFLDESDLCSVEVRKLLSLWQQAPESPLSGVSADREILAEDLGSVAGKRDSNGDERIVVERGHGPQAAGDAGMGLAVGLHAKAARHAHFHF